MTSPATCGLWSMAAREAANAIRRVQAATEAECGRKIHVLRIDNGGELTAAEFASYCADEGVQCHYSAPYNPQQNGVVERHNQTFLGMARALLKQKGMPAVFWGDEVVTAVYILNCSPTKSLNGRTSYEAWHECKLDDRSTPGVFIGVKLSEELSSDIGVKLSEELPSTGHVMGGADVETPPISLVVAGAVVEEGVCSWLIKVEESRCGRCRWR
jgi:hypothetical protein